MGVFSKKQMSEEDIKLQFITPAIVSKWDKQNITMETTVTDGRVNLKGSLVYREKPIRAHSHSVDYRVKSLRGTQFRI